jgi:hypothetical protein
LSGQLTYDPTRRTLDDVTFSDCALVDVRVRKYPPFWLAVQTPRAGRRTVRIWGDLGA